MEEIKVRCVSPELRRRLTETMDGLRKELLAQGKVEDAETLDMYRFVIEEADECEG